MDFKYDVNEIFDMVKEVLGTSTPKGLFCDSDVAEEGSVMPTDLWILTDFDEASGINLDGTERFKVDSGVTKLCIIPNKGKYVIKIPYTGSYEYKTEYYDDELEDWVLIENPVIKPYRYTSRNICDEEIFLYDEASKDLKEFIAPLEFIGFVGEVPVYIQEKIDYSFSDSPYSTVNEDEYFTDESTKSRKKFIKKYCFCTELDTIFVDQMIKKIGFTRAKEVIGEINYDIRDLHRGNYGYINNECKLFDIGGYSSDYWYGDKIEA